MNSLEYIRREAIKVTQSKLADIAGVSQGTVSRWETGELEPTRDQMARIREHAQSQGVDWKDEWFFAAPAPSDERAA